MRAHVKCKNCILVGLKRVSYSVRVRPLKWILGAPCFSERAHRADFGTPPHVGIILTSNTRARRLNSAPLQSYFSRQKVK